jgi:AcrR family transcriptional regulator
MSVVKKDPTAAPRRRLSQADRKDSIAHAAAELFAERGFHATGSRDLAKASGISEALLFRYFPNKEELWKAALESCRRNAIAESLQAIPEKPPSAGGLVALTWELAEDFILNEPGPRVQNRDTIHRMLLRSLAEDGEFARMVAADLSSRLTNYVAACLKAAREAGDLELGATESEDVVSVFFRLQFFAIGAQRLPTPTPVVFDLPDSRLIENLVRFQLRAVGLKFETIERELKALRR